MKIWKAAAAALAMVVGAGQAAAAVFGFTITSSDVALSGSGTLTTVDTADAQGRFLVTGIGGTLGGETITALIEPGLFAGNDNLLAPQGTYLLTNGGISFRTGAKERNVFLRSDLASYRLVNEGDVGFSIGGVPEPATWGLMLVGFGMIGAVLRSRRRSLTVAFARFVS